MTHESTLVIHSASEEDIGKIILIGKITKSSIPGSYSCQVADRNQMVQTMQLELAGDKSTPLLPSGIEVTNHDNLTEGEPQWVTCTYTGKQPDSGVS